MIILPFSFTAHGELLAITDNAIQGSPPYLTFDGGATPATNGEGLLGITLVDGETETTYVKRKSGDVGFKASNPLMLPVEGQKLKDIKTLIPSDDTSVNLSTIIIGNNYWQDANGDSNITFTTDGTLSISATDADGKTVGLSDKLDGCKSPYKVTLKSTAGVFETQYGVPKEAKFDGATADYYIKPKIVVPYTCNTKPNLVYEGGVHASSQWEVGKGFKVQSSGSNFPTTGSHGLSFDITVAGVTAEEVINSTSTTPSSGTGVTLVLSAPEGELTGNVVNIKLEGPKHPLGGDFSASTFAIKANGTTIYNFTIGKWFIARPGRINYPNTQMYCGTTLQGGYRVPLLSDYTNNSVAAGMNGRYTRTIGGGLFAEWGFTSNTQTPYSSSDWEYTHYWSSQPRDGSRQYGANSDLGYIGHIYTSDSTTRDAACVRP